MRAPIRSPGNLSAELDAPFALPARAIDHFRAEGYVKLKQLFSPELLKFYGEAITEQVVRLNTLIKPMAERSTYQRAFLQVMNLWSKDQICRQFSFGKRLARVAAELMGVKGVRIYHDQALYKEAGGGFTPWHADQYYWPLSNDNTCTAWVPLQTTPLEMGPLAFAARSHRLGFGRDLEISDESEARIREMLGGGEVHVSGGSLRVGRDQLPFRLDLSPRGRQFIAASACRHDRHLHGRRHQIGKTAQQAPAARLGSMAARLQNR